MKKLNIINLICVGVALALEIIPYSIKMNWENFFYETSTFHSYFDPQVWENGDKGSIFCGIITAILFVMVLLRLFIKPHRAYIVVMCVLAVSGAMLSAFPVLFDAYTLMGLAITILLGASCEVSVLMHMEQKK